MKLIEVIKEYSTNTIVEKLLKAKTLKERDKLKGQMLAYADFETILKVNEEKPLEKLRAFLEVFDAHGDNLNLFINVTEPRQEDVLLSKMETLKKMRVKLLKYVEKHNGSKSVAGVYSAETETNETGEGATDKSEV